MATAAAWLDPFPTIIFPADNEDPMVETPEIVVFEAAVKRPFESTVKVGTDVAEPYESAVTAVLASVVTLLPELVTSPDIFALVVTVAAFPVIEPAIGELKVCVPVKVCAASVLAMLASVEGNVMVFPSVPAKVKLLFAVRVFPSAMVSVALAAGAVMATLLTEVAVATPMVGVTKVGEVSITNVDPVPV